MIGWILQRIRHILMLMFKLLCSRNELHCHNWSFQIVHSLISLFSIWSNQFAPILCQYSDNPNKRWFIFITYKISYVYKQIVLRKMSQHWFCPMEILSKKIVDKINILYCARCSWHEINGVCGKKKIFFFILAQCWKLS